MWPLNFSSFRSRHRALDPRSRAHGLALRSRRGFTILELVVVVVIGAVVTGMSLGKLHNIADQQKVIRASSTIRTSVEAAFAIATRNRKPIHMAWDASSMQFQVTDRAGTTVFRRVVLNSGAYNLPSGSVTFSASPIEVFPNGLASSAFTITVAANGVTRTISVSRAGMVQSQ